MATELMYKLGKWVEEKLTSDQARPAAEKSIIAPEVLAISRQTSKLLGPYRQTATAKTTPERRPCPEAEKIAPQLEQDYQDNLECLQSYNFIKPYPGKNDRYYYEGDYDGRQFSWSHEHPEKKMVWPGSKNYTGLEFLVPTFQEILSWVTPKQVQLYQKMVAEKCVPGLQLTPLALQIDTLTRAFDSKRQENIQITQQLFGCTVVSDSNIKDVEIAREVRDKHLRYEPLAHRTSWFKGQIVETIGDCDRNEFIYRHQGWLVSVTEAHPKLKKADRPYTQTGRRVARIFDEYRDQGYHGMGFEDYFTSRLMAWKSGQFSETAHSILIETLLYQQPAGRCIWSEGRYILDMASASDEYEYLYFPRSIRISRPRLSRKHMFDRSR